MHVSGIVTISNSEKKNLSDSEQGLGFPRSHRITHLPPSSRPLVTLGSASRSSPFARSGMREDAPSSPAAVTVALDTIMWRPPEDATRSIAPSTTHWPGATGVLWPEGRVAFFNTVLNKSSEWGVSPWHWYFTSALPRALTVSYPLSLVGAALERRVRAALAIGLFYVVVISRLPHKELRFVFPTLPLFTACAASAVGRAWTRRAKITRCVLGAFGVSRRAKKKKSRTKRGGKYKARPIRRFPYDPVRVVHVVP